MENGLSGGWGVMKSNTAAPGSSALAAPGMTSRCDIVFEWGGAAVDPVRQLLLVNPDYMGFLERLAPCPSQREGRHGFGNGLAAADGRNVYRGNQALSVAAGLPMCGGDSRRPWFTGHEER